MSRDITIRIDTKLLAIGLAGIIAYQSSSNYINAKVWNANDETELQRRVQEGQAQQLEMIREMAKIQNEQLREQERIKAEARGESPLHSSQTNFKDSVVIKSSNKPNKDDIPKDKPTTTAVIMPPQTQAQEGQAQQQPLTKEQIDLMIQAMKAQNQRALQKGFFDFNFNPQTSTLNLLETKEGLMRIRTRYGMNTTLIFESPIENYILGNDNAFSINELHNMDNALYITPKLIGIDTNLTVFTKDKKIFNFYLFSTDYRANNLPHLIVRVETPYTEEEKIALALERIRLEALDRDKYITIGEGIESIRINKADIDKRYIQKAKKKNRHLLAEQIFSDKQFTYFKYDREKYPQLPAVWVVIDKLDSPIPTRVVGDYIIVESVADKFTIRLGDSYVCVRKKV